MTSNSTIKFNVKSAFQLTGRHFFILGDLLSGSIKKGMLADLSGIGLNKITKIEAIEFALHRSENNAFEEIGLGFSDLTDTEKDFLKSQSPFSTPIVIVEKNAS